MSDKRWAKVGMCDGPAQATHNDICDGALKHYEKLSNNACSWMNTIPKVIEFYRKYGPDPLSRAGDIPEVRALVEAARCFVSAQKRLPDESVRAAISRRTHFESRLSDALAAFDKGEEPK